MADLMPMSDADILAAIDSAYEERGKALAKLREVPSIELDEAQLGEFMYTCLQSMAENIVYSDDPTLKIAVTVEVSNKLQALGWKESFVLKVMTALWRQADQMAWDIETKE